MYWFCEEAAPDIDYNIRQFHSAKIWITVKAHYESVNPDAPNAKQFDQQLTSRPTTIGEFPLTEENWPDHIKPYREALHTLADRVLQFNARFIKKESGFVLTRIIDCHLLILKYNPIGSEYVPLPKFIAAKKACVNVHNFDNRCFGYAVLISDSRSS